GDDLEQRRLAGAVGADQGRFGTFGDLEADAAKELRAVGKEVLDVGYVDVCHRSILSTRRPPSFMRPWPAVPTPVDRRRFGAIGHGCQHPLTAVANCVTFN